jgi:23S rRNA (adenine2030-N6)-methyltransferase
LNYQHAFHAGNFADLLKHALLIAALDGLTRDAAPLTVIDTHGGAGVYDLRGPQATVSGEAAQGIGRLMAARDAPPALKALEAAVARLNRKGETRLYPGSPRLVADRLRPTDRLVACELRPDEAGRLRQALKGAKAEVLVADGFATAAARARPGQRLLALIDPPYERADDHARAAEAARAILRRNPSAMVLIWLPLKDLESFDGFLRRLEAPGLPPALVVEARLRPLDDPMRMNGCALVALNPPAGFEEAAAQVAAWVVGACGEAGGEARVWPLD